MPDFADCSIVMLAHNGCEFTGYSLNSILAAAVPPRQMIVVNNGSTDNTQEVVDSFAPRFMQAGVDFVSWTNQENLGCSLARNQAWEKTTAKYVLFMDNDTVVCTRNWLELLVAEIEAEPKLGVLGPKLVYPFVPHPIQCAGVGISPRGRIRFRGRGRERHDPKYARRETVPALISACWIKRRELFKELGGLDELFHPVQYEDLDFCMRVNQAGYYCAYTPMVEIYHFEGKTTASSGQSGYWRNIMAQSAKFRKRWKHVITALPDDGEDYHWLADHELGLSTELDLSMVG